MRELKDYSGKVYTSNNYGDVIVLDRIGQAKDYIQIYQVKFINTGTIIESKINDVEQGKIKDPFAINVCGVGYLGISRTRCVCLDKQTNNSVTTIPQGSNWMVKLHPVKRHASLREDEIVYSGC